MPNLEKARLKIESFMTDTCVIGRDIEGVLDDIIDEDTGEITPPIGDETVVYAGKCMIIPAGIGQNEGAQGQPVELPGLRTYRGFIPLYQMDGNLQVPIETISVHDTLVVATCMRDPELVGRVFIVRGIKASTFGIFRELTLEGEK